MCACANTHDHPDKRLYSIKHIMKTTTTTKTLQAVIYVYMHWHIIVGRAGYQTSTRHVAN